MALANVGILTYPPAQEFGTNTANIIDAADEKYAMVVQAPATGNIRKVHFATGTVTTGATVDVRLESVDTSTGNPSGTLFGTNTNAAHLIADTDDNTWLTTAALTADAAVTIGDILAVVIANPAVSFGNIQIRNSKSTYGFIQGGNLPYCSLYTGTWAKSNGAPRLALEYSDGSIYHMPGCDGATTNTITTVTSANNYRGNKLTMPFSCRVIGLWYEAYASTGTITGKLFGADGATALATTTHDQDIHSAAAGYLSRVLFSTPVTVSAGVTYYAAIAADGTNAVTFYFSLYNSVAILQAMSDSGSAACWSQTSGTPASTSDWTDTTTRIVSVGLIIDQIDVSSGPLVGPGRLIRN